MSEEHTVDADQASRQVVVPHDVLEPRMTGGSRSRCCSHDGLVCRRSRRAPQDGSLRCGESERDIKRGRGPVFVSHTETFHAPATSARPRSAILMLDCLSATALVTFWGTASRLDVWASQHGISAAHRTAGGLYAPRASLLHSKLCGSSSVPRRVTSNNDLFVTRVYEPFTARAHPSLLFPRPSSKAKKVTNRT